jgi:hypothetical protein
MADALGTWFTADIDLTKLLEPVQPVLNTVDGVLELLIDALNVLQALLDTIKAFIVGLLDPIRALVEAIINEIRAFINDLRNLGAYLYLGDAARAQYPYQDLIGGYAGFQRRMVTAYTDTSDPKRPVFSGSTAVLSVYFYLSVQVTDLYKIIELVVALCRFFGGFTNESLPYPAPIPVSVTYGTSNTLLNKFGTLGVALATGEDIEYALVEWQMPAGGQAFIGSAGPAPNGFVIEVCTEPEGFLVWADGPDPRANATGGSTARKRFGVADPALPNSPLRVFGGLDTVAFAPLSGTPETTEGVNVNATYAFLATTQTQSSAALVVLSELARLEQADNRRYLGRSFFVQNSLFGTMTGGQNFMAVIPKSLLPYTGEFSMASPGGSEVLGALSVKGAYQPDTYSVVVRAVSKQVADTLTATASHGAGTISSPYYDFGPLFYLNDATIRGVTASVVTPQKLNGNFSPLSPPLRVTFPGSVADAVAAALLVALLSRSDLPVVSGGGFQPNTALTATGLEFVAADLLKYMRVDNPNKYFSTRTPAAFRSNLKTKVYGYLSVYLPKLGQSLLLVEESEEAVGTLLSFKWSDIGTPWPAYTLLETLSDTSQDAGLFPSASFLQPPKFPTVTGLARAPGFGATSTASTTQFFYGQGSCDDAPLLVGSTETSIAFCRNLIPEEVYAAARTVLLLSSPAPARQQGSQWANVLLFPNGFPQVLAILDNVEQFLLTLLDGLQGIADTIVAFIEALQARITQLQALLEQIRALLDIVSTLRLGNVSVLVTVEAGTSGALRAFMAAENAPVDTAADYGFGFSLVVGGAPSVAVDLLSAIFTATA